MLFALYKQELEGSEPWGVCVYCLGAQEKSSGW